MKDAGPWQRSPLTVQGLQTLVLLIMGVLVLAGAVGGGLLMNRTDDVSSELINVITPSRSAAYRLQASLRDQETAVRGYAISADPQFLSPYHDGQIAEATALNDIRQRAQGRTELVADVEAIEAAAATWRAAFAEPLIASVAPGRPGMVDPNLIDRGKAEFDRIRGLFDIQNQDLAAARTAGIANLDAIRAWRDRVLIAIIVVVLIAAVALAVVMQTAVTRPLKALAAACRRTSQGNFTQKIEPHGPKDIRGIAADVENMRQQIVDELETTQSARTLLITQKDVLDEQAIELRRSNAELEQFAYVASHDLQEPLRKVAAFCQLLERRYGDKLDERGIEYISFAVDGAKRMQALINDLLTFSRVGRLNAAYSDVDLNLALGAALENLSTAVEESGATIALPGDPFPRIHGDSTLLSMVWQNLIGNAVKFHRPDVAPTIVIECEPRRTDHADQWLFTVSDNGIGIDDEFVDKVFVIFQRLHVRDAYSGTGIGLALCKKIIEHHGGTIWIDTSYTGGTRFRFTLPQAAVPTAQVERTPAATMEGSSQ
ncbi:CHASE3 domain-containing protein [soil metagenome]